MKTIDARGLGCPQPVLLAGQAMDAGEERIVILVDNADAAENIRRFAAGRGYAAAVPPGAEDLRVELSRAADAPSAGGAECAAPRKRARRVLLIDSDSIGRPSEELGKVLTLAFLNTLADNPVLPATILLYNGGVKLACEDEDAVQALGKLAARGVDIRACGTCLGYFGLRERLKIGRVSNAHEILNLMLEGDTFGW
jgi:selenium metabolism protein YedF